MLSSVLAGPALLPSAQQASPALLPSAHLAGPALRLAPPTMLLRENVGRGVVGVADQVDGSVSSELFRSGFPEPDKLPDAVVLQGTTLRTWSFDPFVEQCQVVLGAEGRSLDATVELWHGPGNSPCRMKVYCENGYTHPFSAVIETPRGPNTVAVRNIAPSAFPLAARVIPERVDGPSAECRATTTIVQGGGGLRWFPFDPSIESVQVLIETEGRPLNARIELLQGPNNNKQVIELYTEDGWDRPFFGVIETPGAGNVVRVVNTGPAEFPMAASVVPHPVSRTRGFDPRTGVAPPPRPWRAETVVPTRPESFEPGFPLGGDELMDVAVPEGVYPGQLVSIKAADGASFEVEVPQNYYPGDVFRTALPRRAAAYPVGTTVDRGFYEQAGRRWYD